MPYPKQHACTLRSPEDFQPKSFRILTEGQLPGVELVIARPKGQQHTALQEVRYDAAAWSEVKAATDAEARGGSLEIAVPGSPDPEHLPEANYIDVLGLLLEGNEESWGLIFPDIDTDRDPGADLDEAATIKSQVQGLLRQADALLKAKDLPKGLVDNVKSVRTALTKTWAEIVKDDAEGGGKDGEDAAVSSPAAASESLAEATKTEGGEQFPAGDYAYVPDPSTPSTWKLRLTRTPGGTPDAGIVGAAIAALGKGFRGQKVQIPDNDLPAVKAKVRAAWKKANPDKGGDEMPDVIREAEDIEIENEFIALVEATKAAEILPIKVIQPGWGSSGYYAPEVLEKAAANYTPGTQMFWDHPSRSEEGDRPERSLRDLAGVLVSPGQYRADGPEGPGIYADAKVFGPYKEVLGEIGSHIGISHRAMGKARTGEAEGRKGPIIENISHVQSVDFVTAAGAGGKVLQLFEAAKGGQYMPPPDDNDPGKEDEMTEAERREWEGKLEEAQSQITTLQEQNTTLQGEVNRFKEGDILRAAGVFVGKILAESQIPDLTKERLTASLCKNPPTIDGKLDEATFKTQVEEAIKAEIDYLSTVAPAGVIRGMGPSKHVRDEDKGTLKESLKRSYLRQGMSDEEAEKHAAVAAAGR